ncbi:MAG: hypothetical protein EZS28_035240 [Streblomastix strix]|uniref:Uncharacterized protein n=1 Tax=Streblomastix strix TaxID=222440 RepID=A0A5J4UG92_9EUKA|nr:MAG: hypothetical protein EZS28_035240 [Streblomastix strix]
MQSNQDVNGIAGAIISFTESDTKNKQEKQNEQSDSEQTPSLTDMVSYLESLSFQIIYNKQSCKQVTQIPKLLKSLIALVTFRLGTHLSEQTDLLRLNVRYLSRLCLRYIQDYGDAQVHSELVNQGYGRVISISFCTAGGAGEEQDEEIFNGLICIYKFLRELHEGRTYGQSSFQPLPLLARITEEHIKEEGAIEEIEAQMNNKGQYGYIKNWATWAKSVTLNRFIHRR